jgi:hypothetical protein
MEGGKEECGSEGQRILFSFLWAICPIDRAYCLTRQFIRFKKVNGIKVSYIGALIATPILAVKRRTISQCPVSNGLMTDEKWRQDN